MKRCRKFGSASCHSPFQCCEQSPLAWHAWRWAGIFLAMFATDLAWAAYVSSVKSGAAVYASLWAVALFLLGAVAILGYTRDKWLLIPGALGAFAGTWSAITWNL